MKYTTIQKLSFTVLATLVCGSVMASPMRAPAYQGNMIPYRAPAMSDSGSGPFYSNFRPNNTCGDGCTYDDGDGYFIFGANNCFGSGADQDIAWSFVASKSGKVKTIDVAVTEDPAICVGTMHQFTITVYNDNCGPSTPVKHGSKTVTAATMPCGVSTASFGKQGPSLHAGDTYWVACSGADNSDFTGVWWGSYDGDQGYFVSTGTVTYAVAPTGIPGAFDVL